MRRLLSTVHVCLVAIAATFLSVEAVLATDKSEEAREATVPTKKIRTLDFSQFDENIVKDFQNVWTLAKTGKDPTESVMLLFRAVGGGYKSRVLPPTNEHKKSTFDLPSHALAIFHTHPSECEPYPSPEDKQIADKHRVLMFTLTVSGMYVYDPHTKKTTRVVAGIDWLDKTVWTASLAERMASFSPAFRTDSSQISSR